MTDLKPEDLVKLRERLAKVGVEQGSILPAGLAWVPASFESLLADRARMEKALREAERELAFAVEHMGRTGGGYERALVSVRQALGASQ